MTARPILLVEDDARLREALAETLRLSGFKVLLAGDGSEALQILEGTAAAAVVTDYQMAPMDGSALLARIRARWPQLPVLMITAHGSIEHAVASMMAGASDYLVKPFAAQALVDKLERLVPRELPANGMIASDPATLETLALAARVAASDTTVLLSGESGTGKEVFARFIHQHSRRAAGPFVAINCAAIPENMLEALLFGHEKGAFTGAHEARPGKFEQAQGGTLLLDEISEMCVSLQAKLLRVLQEREVERIGGRGPLALDVRVLATTNQDLRALVRAGRFREDLYYRLSVFPLGLPPLRQRPGDIVPLAEFFIAGAAERTRPIPALTADAASALLAYHWPGNVRELANLMQRAVILAGHRDIGMAELRFEEAPAPIVAPTAAGTPLPQDSDTAHATSATGLHGNLQSVEGRLILDAIERSGSRKRAAELLGISPRTLRYKLARLRDAGLVPSREEAGALAG
ncbi:MAG: sigma-54-dependent Fis family transcriptional regulator [Gammaproteobacteria bacterium]|nr:sigma-54-dependent Fis family transcriptional regulator [Gammaproteobacteria bacterium]